MVVWNWNIAAQSQSLYSTNYYQPGSTNSVIAILARKYSINFISFVHFHHFREYAGNKLKVGVFRIHLLVIRFGLWFFFFAKYFGSFFPNSGLELEPWISIAYAAQVLFHCMTLRYSIGLLSQGVNSFHTCITPI